MTTALVIEDNENNMVLISRILRRAGYNVVQTMTGNDGYRVACEQTPDFIILDIQLPDIPGTEVLKKLRESGITIPVIAMTSYAMAGDRERLMAAGCNGYIEKPIDPLLVMSQIEKVINPDLS